MANNNRKKASVVAASALAAALALAGTFAWMSISQTAVNESAGTANPGGRLHDDFNGTNKDVYVENFTDSDKGGQEIFARVRLDEYMETGLDAGKNRDAADRDASPIVEGASIKDVTTWKTHKLEDTGAPFHDYCKWTTGGSTTFMPTFNKNKDSLKADINGTFAGTDNDPTTDEDRYKDYVDYSKAENATKTTDAVYDADENDVEENPSVENTNIKTVSEEHTAKATQNAEVITMEQWKTEKGSQPGKYWVYDTDGWAYWAEPIQPGEATGLLLDGIEMKNVPNENWYYAINVVGQFVTVDDIDKYNAEAGGEPTADAKELLRKASAKVRTVTVTAAGNATSVVTGEKLQFNVAVAGTNLIDSEKEITWTLTGTTNAGTKISETGELTVAGDEAAETLTVEATSKYDTTKKGTMTVRVIPSAQATAIRTINGIEAGSINTVTIDGIDFYVAAKDAENNRALIWTKEILAEEKVFGTTNIWKDSGVRKYLNEEWITTADKPTLNAMLIETPIMTRKTYTSTDWDTTTDKVFLLSEADVFGTIQGGKTATANDYTYGTTKFVTDAQKGKGYSLRSPGTTEVGVTFIDASGNSNPYAGCTSAKKMRPALWVNLAS